MVNSARSFLRSEAFGKLGCLPARWSRLNQAAYGSEAGVGPVEIDCSVGVHTDPCMRSVDLRQLVCGCPPPLEHIDPGHPCRLHASLHPPHVEPNPLVVPPGRHIEDSATHSCRPSWQRRCSCFLCCRLRRSPVHGSKGNHGPGRQMDRCPCKGSCRNSWHWDFVTRSPRTRHY